MAWRLIAVRQSEEFTRDNAPTGSSKVSWEREPALYYLHEILAINVHKEKEKALCHMHRYRLAYPGVGLIEGGTDAR